jgi:hypothetical protein
VDVHWAWIMWSVHTLIDLCSAEPMAGTGRGEVVYVHWRREASSSGSGVTEPLFAVEVGVAGSSVMFSVRAAVFNWEGAAFERACSMPCTVNSEMVFISEGGVMAAGDIEAGVC